MTVDLLDNGHSLKLIIPHVAIVSHRIRRSSPLCNRLSLGHRILACFTYR
jgi:hypothetical protein